jgi:hypothetical protein
MAKPEEIIEEALKYAQSKGVRIIRGAQYEWPGGQGHLPSGCDAIGALRLLHGHVELGFPKGWLWETCQLIGKDTYWFWLWTMGWNYHQRVNLLVPDAKKKDKMITIRDEVSRSADDLAKRYVK